MNFSTTMATVAQEAAPPASLFLDDADVASSSSEFDDLTGDGGVLKRTLFPGTGAAPPVDAVALLHLQSAVHPGGAPLHLLCTSRVAFRTSSSDASDGEGAAQAAGFGGSVADANLQTWCLCLDRAILAL